MKRKQFILQSAIIAAGLQASSYMKEKKQIGVQLWSLKAAIQENVDETLKQVAKAGYSFVEPAGHDLDAGTFHGLKPGALKQKVNDLGMKMYSGHCRVDVANAEKACEKAAEAGFKFIVRPSLSPAERKNADSYKKMADDFNKVGEVAKKYGMQFGFHNHAQEFEEKDGQIPYDILLQNTNSENVIFQMDLGWLVFAERSPVDYFKKYPGRFPLWHIRDLDGESKKAVAIGQGNIDLASVFKEKKLAGFKYGIVEMSSDNPHAMQGINESFDYLSKAKWY